MDAQQQADLVLKNSTNSSSGDMDAQQPTDLVLKNSTNSSNGDMDEVDARQAMLIKSFVSSADSVESMEQLARLISDAIGNNNLIYFSHILSLPCVSRLAGTDQAWTLDLLRLFAFGTWHDYKRNVGSYNLTPPQMQSLKQLHMIALVESRLVAHSKVRAHSKEKQNHLHLSYDMLQEELDIPDAKEFEDFLQVCKTKGFVRFQVGERRLIVAESSSPLLTRMRGKVPSGESFDVFLQKAAIICTDPTGLLSNGIVKQVRVPVSESSSCVKVEYKERGSCLFGMLIEHVTNAHSCSKSFGGKIYAGMFVVIGYELFLRTEAIPTEELTNDNSKLDYLAIKTMFWKHTSLPVSLDDPEGECMHPIYSNNLFDHLGCVAEVLSNRHYGSPMRKAMDGNYTTFLRCHASLQSTSAHQAVLVHVRKHHKYSTSFDKEKFNMVMNRITPEKDWQHFWLFQSVLTFGKDEGRQYLDDSAGCFTFIRDWGTHVRGHLTESQKMIFTAAVRSYLIEHCFKDFFAQAIYQIICCYTDKKDAFRSNFKEWLLSLLRVTKVDTVSTTRESNKLGLSGLLLPSDISLKDLMERFLLDMKRMDENARGRPQSLAKWSALNNLRDKNITVYYKVLIDKVEEYSSIVYVPTVKTVAQNSRCMFARPGVMRVSKENRDEMTSIMRSWPSSEVDMIVVADGSSLSGTDDTGVEGVSVIIGKMDLYVAAAGMNPQRVLPVIIDVGTNNLILRHDPLYRGLQDCRLSGEECLAVIDEFMVAAFARWHSVIVQFEDMNLGAQLFKKYTSSHRVLNDTIEGTTAVTIAGLLGVARAQARSLPHFANQKVVIVASCSDEPALDFIRAAIRTMQMVSGTGVSFASAAKQFWIVDHNGLVTENRSGVSLDVCCLARKKRDLNDLSEGDDFNKVVKATKPNIIILLSAITELSTQEVLQAVKGSCSTRPAIFELSAQSESQSRCTPEKAFSTLGEKVIYASGDQFPHFNLGNGKVGFSNHINKIYLSPGIVLGTLLSGARIVSDQMIFAASKCLASLVEEKDVRKGILYPPISSLRNITQKVAAAVLRRAVDDGIAAGYGAMDKSDLAKLTEEETISYIAKNMWSPLYPT